MATIHLKKCHLSRIFWRSFFIQGSWTFKGLIAIGFCFSLIPVAKCLYQDHKKRREFLLRHLEFFNSHPYYSSYALGAVAKLEQDALLKNWDNLNSIATFKKRMVSILGVIGDRMFWDEIKPLTSGIGFVLAILLGWVALPIYLLIYNIAHFYVRIQGLRRGFKGGFDVVSCLSMRRYQKYFNITTVLGCFVAGIAVVVVSRFHTNFYDINPTILFLSAAVALILLLLQRSMLFVLAVVSLLSIGLGFIF